MDAAKGKKAVYSHIESLLLKHKDDIVSDLIKKGCSPKTADKVAREVWLQFFHKSR